jgi:hypothetical protein
MHLIFVSVTVVAGWLTRAVGKPLRLGRSVPWEWRRVRHPAAVATLRKTVQESVHSIKQCLVVVRPRTCKPRHLLVILAHVAYGEENRE